MDDGKITIEEFAAAVEKISLMAGECAKAFERIGEMFRQMTDSMDAFVTAAIDEMDK